MGEPMLVVLICMGKSIRMKEVKLPSLVNLMASFECEYCKKQHNCCRQNVAILKTRHIGLVYGVFFLFKVFSILIGLLIKEQIFKRRFILYRKQTLHVISCFIDTDCSLLCLEYHFCIFCY